jgi:hypothetical protein
MVYWIKVPSTTSTTVLPDTQLTPGMAWQTATPGEAIQVSPGGVFTEIMRGTIYNPLAASDQGLITAESLFVDFTGPAYSFVTKTTRELDPGESIDIPADCLPGAWVCAASGGHKFTIVLQQAISSIALPTDIQVQGSFHYETLIEQRESSTVDSNSVILTALSEVQPFNQLGPDYLYLAHYRDMTFAFEARGRLYEQADLYHYRGHALFSTNVTQVIDDPSTFNPKLIVSNSLPIWLYMPIYVPPYPGFTCPVPLYPSYLVTENLIPPFGAVHINDTNALEMTPYLGPRLQSSQLCQDKVKIHLYGTDNETSITFLNFIEQYSRDWNTIGFASSPCIRDEKQIQPELRILAQYKCVEMEVNYRQQVSRDVARQLIEHAKVQFYDPHWITDIT